MVETAVQPSSTETPQGKPTGGKRPRSSKKSQVLATETAEAEPPEPGTAVIEGGEDDRAVGEKEDIAITPKAKAKAAKVKKKA